MPRSATPRALAALSLVLAMLALTAPASGQADRLIGPSEIDFPTVSGLFQARVKGKCPQGGAIRRIKRKGSVLCSKPVPTVRSLSTSGGLTGAGTGAVALGVDTNVLQSRIGGGCSGREAIQSVGQDGSVTCLATGTGAGTVSSVGSGFGLSGGPITDSGTLAADPAVLQRRVAGDCSLGEALRAIAQDGSATCDPFVRSVTAGAGLTGGTITDTGTIAVNPAAVQSRVSDGCTGNGAVKSILQDGSVTCQAAGTGTVTSVASGFGLMGGPITNSGTIAVDPTAVQSRVTGTCAGTQALQIVNQAGSVNCSPTLQSRINGSCVANSAVANIAADGTPTCRAFVTGVTAGTGLTGGAISSSGTIAVDSAAVQTRVGGTCTGSQAVQGVAQNGTVSCGTFAPAGTARAGFSQPSPGTQATILSTKGVTVITDCTIPNQVRLLIQVANDTGANIVGTQDTAVGNENPLTLAGTYSNQTVPLLTGDFERGEADIAINTGPNAGTSLFLSGYAIRSGNFCQGQAMVISSTG